MDGSLSPMIATAQKPVAAIDSVDGYDLWAASKTRCGRRCQQLRQVRLVPADSPALGRCGGRPRQTTSCGPNSADLKDFQVRSLIPKRNFAYKLAGLAAYINAGLPIRVVTISAAGGYDTHSGQAEDLSRNLKETCDGLLAFQRDLESRGLADRVMVEVWSEFGRRPEETARPGPTMAPLAPPS